MTWWISDSSSSVKTSSINVSDEYHTQVAAFMEDMEWDFEWDLWLVLVVSSCKIECSRLQYYNSCKFLLYLYR